ncbi:MAG: hypothetical protein HY841_11310 [Bacteroidetes bacterium]|nr:hypothetical protein [Bacteroidota bacterium]
MPLSKGQKIVALVFLISFIITMIWAYRSDARINKMFYKNVWVVLISVLLIFGAIIVLIKISHSY